LWGDGDVVVVAVRAQDRADVPVAHGGGDGVGVVGGVDDEHLLVVTDQPDIVVDVPGAAVEREGPGGDHPVDARAHQTTTERSTLPAPMAAKAASTSSIPMRSVTNRSSGSLPWR